MHLKTKYVLAGLLTTLLSLSLALQPCARARETAATNLNASGIDRVELHQALLDLTNPWTLMCVAAHPDDEDGTSLIVLRHKYGVHTVSLFSTFGEGGQNAIGPELYEEMGAIRARETMAAAEIQGSEPHFLGLKDFGFSKSADEAFKFWGHDEALRRMVLQIRTLRPDVIITNHDTGNGHGHHQATGRLLLESFEAAADATRFPEQLKDGIGTWQVKRIFLRVGFGNRATAQTASTVTIDPNERDPVRGTVYAEEALRALQQHATQGPWPKSFADMLRVRNSQDGKLPLVRYTLVREAKGAPSLPADSHYFLDGLRLPDDVAKQFEPPTIEGKPLPDALDEPDRVLQALLSAKKNLKPTGSAQQTEAPRLARREQLLDRAIGAAAGITISINPANPIIPQNGQADLTVKISNHGSQRPWVEAGFAEVRNTSPFQIEPDKSHNLKLTYHAGPDAPITVPHSQHLYDGTLFKLLPVSVGLKINGVGISLPATTWFDVAPPVEIADLQPTLVVVTPTTKLYPPLFSATIRNHEPIRNVGRIVVSQGNATAGATTSGTDFTIAAAQALQLKVPTAPPVVPDRSQLTAGVPPRSLAFSISTAGGTKAIQRKVPLVYADAHVAPNLRVGWIRGFDYSLPNALVALGVESQENRTW